MKFTSFLGKLLLILGCLALTQPVLNIDASAKSQKTVKKISKKKQTITKKTSRTIKASGEDAERSLWLKRAGNSQILTGKASWYGKDFHNKKTASGVKYDMHTFTAAHRTLPIGTVVKVTDQANGKSVMVTINDRGPFVHGRIIDLSYAAAKKLGLENRGVGKVALEVISDPNGKPLHGDKAYFVDYGPQNGRKRVGPFNAFEDASAMGEALRTAHIDVDVVLEKVAQK